MSPINAIEGLGDAVLSSGDECPDGRDIQLRAANAAFFGDIFGLFEDVIRYGNGCFHESSITGHTRSVKRSIGDKFPRSIEDTGDDLWRILKGIPSCDNDA